MAADSEYLRLAAKSSPIALTVIDPTGNCTLIEGGGVAAIPMELRPVIGESVFHPSANPAFIDAVRRGLQGESVTQTFGSNDRQFEVLCSPLLDDNDSVCGVTAFLLDVTGRHDADATAVRAHRLETLSSMTVTNSALTDAAGLNDMLGRLAERAKVLVQADYAALSIFADGGRLERFIYTGMPDGGVPEGQDAGLRPVVVSAIGGTVEVKALDLDAQEGRLNADVTLLFENNEGLVGQVGAYPCDRVK